MVTAVCMASQNIYYRAVLHFILPIPPFFVVPSITARTLHHGLMDLKELQLLDHIACSPWLSGFAHELFFSSDCDTDFTNDIWSGLPDLRPLSSK
jgi:hypothetical protein